MGGTRAKLIDEFAREFQPFPQRRNAVSIVRVGLGETKNFAEGYEAIFGKKDDKKKAEEAKTTEPAKKDGKADEKK